MEKKGSSAEEYFVGLDIGTNSVGWAVTNLQYELLKCKGHKMWGSRLFPEGQVAEARRMARASRRRLARRRDRLHILEELFSAEISKVDPTFFLRLKESIYHFEDKTTKEKYVLFADKNFDDGNFYKKYPTIYHLRSTLTKVAPDDIRELFLAIHHIMKYRGNFVYEGEKFETTENLRESLKNLLDDLGLWCDDNKTILPELENIILNKFNTKSDKAKQFAKYFAEVIKKQVEKNNFKTQVDEKRLKKQIDAIGKLLVGLKTNVDEVFLVEEFKELEDTRKIEFSKGDYIEERDKFKLALGDRINTIDIAKTIYDTIILSKIKKSGMTLSESKVEDFKKHQKELCELKALLKSDKNLYNEVLKDQNKADNYVHYIKKTKSGKSNCSREEFYKYIKSVLEKLPNSDIKDKILKEIELETYLPLLRVSDNGVIPYQIHLEELKLILDKAKSKFTFLENIAGGLSVADKILALFTFRIPYYVGPLNPTHKVGKDRKNKKGGFSWVVRKESGKVYPWNFDEKIDRAASANQFIRNMTNKCTYLVGEDVLPKHSLLYCEFTLLNELNNIRYEGKPLSVEIKGKLIEEIFKREGHKRVTDKVIQKFLETHGIDVNSGSITGLDIDIKSDLKSFRDMVRIFGEGFDHEMAEKIILWVTLFGDEKKILKTRISNEYGDAFVAAHFDQIKKLKYKDWGRLSKAFLQLKGIVEDNEYTVIEALKNTSYNLMQLLSDQFTFISNIDEFNKRLESNISGNEYDLIEEMTISPAVKRSVWQALKLVNEITELKEGVPKKIFVEVPRTNRSPKTKKSARKERILELYKSIKGEIYKWEQALKIDENSTNRQWEKEIKERDASQFKSKKLYLYYQQMGKCMYSGEPIDMDALFTNYYDIDHIYPRTLVKDDSFDNLVLVKKEENAEKADTYPIKETKQVKMKAFWKMLKEKSFISEKKFERLIRKDALSADELANFISRQLVETSQSVKATTTLLKRLYPNTEIVYVKAENVTDFRHEYDFIKSRSINNHHHAKDAYLTIVVGNVYHEKFTKNPRNFIKNGYKFDRHKGKYHVPYTLNHMFNDNLIINNKVIWDKNDSIKIVKEMMQNNDVRVTKKALEQKGLLFDLTISKHDEIGSLDGYNPIKLGDEKLLDVKKYGGHKNIRNSYYSIFEYVNSKGDISLDILAIPISISKNLRESQDYEDYIKTKLSGSKVKLIYKKLCINTLLKIDGCYYRFGGKAGGQFYVDSAIELIFDYEVIQYIKKIEKYIDFVKENTGLVPNSQITKEENLKVFDILIDKLEHSILKKSRNNKYKSLIGEGRTRFISLPLDLQCIQLIKLVELLAGCGSRDALNLCGLKWSRPKINADLTKCKEFVIINESITGLNRNEVKII